MEEIEKVVFDKNKVHKFEAYDELIGFFKSREGDVHLDDFYCERHHIVARSCGGSNKKDNLVFLPYRYHIQAHWLRALEYKELDNDLYWKHMSAVHMLLVCPKKVGDREQILYKLLTDSNYVSMLAQSKAIVSEENKWRFSGKNNPNYGKTLTREQCKKIAAAHRGKKASEETRRKLSEAAKGRKISNEAKRKSMLSQSVIVHQFDYLSGSYIQSFYSRRDAYRYTHISDGSINHQLSGKYTHTCGFTWGYELGDNVLHLVQCPKDFKSIGYKKDINIYSKMVHQYTLDNEYIQSFISVRDADKYTKVDRGAIKRVTKGLVAYAGGFKWSHNAPLTDIIYLVDSKNKFKADGLCANIKHSTKSRIVHKFDNNVYICSFKSLRVAESIEKVPRRFISEICTGIRPQGNVVTYSYDISEDIDIVFMEVS